VALPKVLVRTNERIANYGGALYDWEQDVNIRAEPVLVEQTALVTLWLSRGELVLADAGKQSDEVAAGQPWPEGIGANIVSILEEYGLSPEDIPNLTDDELSAIRGIGKNRVKEIRKAFRG